MELTDRQLELLEKKHRASLSEEESAELNLYMQEEDFAKEAESHLRIFTQIETSVEVELREQMSEWDKSHQRLTTLRRPWLKFAATFMIIGMVASLFYINQNSSADNINSYYTVYPNVITVRGEADTTQLSNALAYYDEGKFDSAISLLTTIETTDGSFYLAQSYFGLEMYAKASAQFQHTKAKESNYSDIAGWYIALCEYKLDETKAKVLLQQIAESNSFYAADAEDFLRKI